MPLTVEVVVSNTLMFRKNGTLYDEAVLREDFQLPVTRLYENLKEVEKRLRELGVSLERIENLKSYFESGEDTVLIELP